VLRPDKKYFTRTFTSSRDSRETDLGCGIHRNIIRCLHARPWSELLMRSATLQSMSLLTNPALNRGCRYGAAFLGDRQCGNPVS
jgi:hypothetical protein